MTTWGLCAVFLLSGAAGLLFETLWFRQAGLAFGNGIWASSLVLSSFMAGLALGNGLAARFGNRILQPVRLYALLEAVIAATGVALVFLLPELAGGLAPLWRPFLDQPWILNPLRLVVGFTLLLIPATAMGATLPLLVKALRARDTNFGAVLGRLYGWNTAGAVLGAVAGEAALIAWFGVRGTAWVAAGLNLAAAAGALALAARVGHAATPRAEPRAPVAGLRRALPLLAAALLAGSILLALEVVWFRLLSLFVYSAGLSFALMLAIVLAGIALGGFAGGLWLRRRPQAFQHVPGIALLAGCAAVGSYIAFGMLIDPAGAPAVERSLEIVWLGAVLMFPVALLSGVLFPLTGAALERWLAPDTRAAGLLTLANTVGGALGALAGGFVLLPALGMERSLQVLATLYGGVGVFLLGARRAAVHPGPRWPLAAAGVAFAFALYAFPDGAMRNHHFSAVARRFGNAPGMEIALAREGRTETVLYLRTSVLGEPLFHRLVTDGFGMATDRVWAQRYMKLFVYWPMALQPEARSALLISYGIGGTAKALTDTAGLERIDVVDISEDVLEASNVAYPDAAEHPLRDPRVRVHVEDGRFFLQTTPQHYDLITSEPPPPRHAGVVNLYTREYFQLVHDRLTPGGINTYWLPVHSLSPEETRSIIAAYCEVFPDCSLWTTARLNWMLVGSRDANWSRDGAAFTRQWRDERVGRELRALGVEKPEQLGTMFLADADQLREIVGATPPLEDDFPKRLQEGRARSDAHDAHARWMDTQRARERFATSTFVADAWPADLRERTLAYFDLQRMLTRSRGGLTAPRGNRTARFRELHQVLTETDLETLPLWQVGVERGSLRVVDRLLERGGSARPHAHLLGARALARRQFADAARHFARADGPDDAYLEVYALALAGRPAAAQRAARRRLGPGVEQGAWWAWLVDTFDLEAPGAG
ncbi:MAG: spermidine synthase [Myxococcota bacterium]|nr:spermidine synthase [Myxococcota bacterium]